MVRTADPVEWVPEPACRHGWVPVEAPKRRRSRKCEDAPVRRGGGVASVSAGDVEQVGVAVPPECAEVRSGTGGDVDA